jgi:DNA-binding NtrC family response regulator
VSRPQPLELAVFSTAGLSVHPLRAGAKVVVGRGAGVDIDLEDAGVSRRHAVFHVGPPLEVEDLGSANGTFVSQASLHAGRALHHSTGDQTRTRVSRTVLAPGDTVFLGNAIVVVRPTPVAVAARPEAPPPPIVHDPVLARVYDEAARAAQLSLPILLLGETGVGKEVLAHFIHQSSKRASKPLLALNCAALSESLAESELFGHEKGAFTGALQTRAGLFESASGGTVFLDEIGELPPTVQAKLLRALETSEVQRVGSVKPIRVDVRLVSATNRDLAREATAGRFRQDLFFRINGLALRVPPLRERRVEIGELAERFLATASRQAGLAATPAISEDAMRMLEAYAWPGNVRELRYVMERTLVMAGAGPVAPEHLPEQIRAVGLPPSAGPGAATRERVVEALEACEGNQTRAAEMLGISRRTLINRMIDFGLPRPRKT